MPRTRYAQTPDGIYLAYQVVGEGPVDIAWQFDFTGNVDTIWESPMFGEWFRGLASFGRLILHDRRGTGLSSRNVPPPDLETRVADLLVVLEAVGAECPVLAGSGEGGAPHVLLAATDAARARSLVWTVPSARVVWTPDYPWGIGPKYVERERLALELWGTDEYAGALAEAEGTQGVQRPDASAEKLGKMTRHTCTPDVARELTRIWYETDVQDILPVVEAPALLLVGEDDERATGETEYIASLMPHAQVAKLPGESIPRPDQVPAYVKAVGEFLGVAKPPAELDRVLATVLFTDIVDSTKSAAQLGDSRWRELLAEHDRICRRELQRFNGRFDHTTGDGMLATFDGPARAVRCATEIAQAVRSLGLAIRAGCHTGEVELSGEEVQGVAVHIGARVAAMAGPGEVWASSTVKDLTAGSGLTFEDAGEHELKGVPDRWHLYKVVSD